MRNKTMHKIWDYLLWGGLTLLPIFAMLLSIYRTGTIISLTDAFNQINLGVLSNNIVTNSLADLFGTSGVLPIFTNTIVFDFVAYYVFIELLHLFADFILFIPNLAHKWLNKFTKGE